MLVGGYDGVTPSADVWETTDGVTFTVLARLPQPVRYPAVAAVGFILLATAAFRICPAYMLFGVRTCRTQ